MKKWLLLSTAILLEVSGTLALRAAIDDPAWYALVVTGYAGSFVAMTYLLRLGIGVGVAYGIWAACGVALTAVFANVLFGDALTGTMVAGIVLIAAGVLCVELGSQAAQARELDARAAQARRSA